MTGNNSKVHGQVATIQNTDTAKRPAIHVKDLDYEHCPSQNSHEIQSLYGPNQTSIEVTSRANVPAQNEIVLFTEFGKVYHTAAKTVHVECTKPKKTSL